jgi:ribosome maturation factor RimP
MTKGPKVMSEEIVNRVRALADPILSSEGMDLVEIQYRREANGWVVRLTIDKEGGVTLDDCSRVNQEVGRILDVEDFIPMRYHLEVSSPGLDRALKNEKDFLKYRNRLIKVKTLDPIDKRRQFKGRLLGLVENHIQMEIDGGIIRIPLSNVSKANLEIEF